MKKIFLSVMIFLLSRGAWAMSLTQKMDVHIGVFDAAKVTLKYESNQNRFSIRADVTTANLFDTIYPFKASYQSMGHYLNDKLIPEIYQTRSQSRNHVRTKKILYNKDGIAYKKISSKDNNVNQGPIVGVSKTADAGDLQSVFAELIKNFAAVGHCNLTREIDDGKKHYKMIAKDKGVQEHYFDFYKKKEKAHLCSIYVENLKDNNDNILWNVSADRPIKLWVKRDEKTKTPFVLEISIDSTPLGALKVVPITLVIK